MKFSPRFAYAFAPSSSTLDLSANAGFSIRGLVAVLDSTTNSVLYAASAPGFGYSALSNGVLTLQASMSGCASSDNLVFFYDDGLPVGSNPDTAISGTITATDAVVAAPAGDGTFRSGASTAGSTVTLRCPGGDSAWNASITGLTSGTLYFEGSVDSTTGADGNWISLDARQNGLTNTMLSTSTTTNGMFRGNTSGLACVRVRSVGALSGTPLVRLVVCAGTAAVLFGGSLPAGSNQIGSVGQGAPGTAANAWFARATDGTNTAAVKAASATAAGTDPALVVALSPNSPVSPPALAKGVQTSTGFSVQSLIDAGRAAFYSYAEAVGGATTEALFTQSISQAYGAVSTATSFTVPAGKTLRLTTLTVAFVATTTTANATRIRLRVNTAGAATISSNPVWSMRVGLDASTVVSGQAETVAIPFVDGLEIPANAGLALSHVEAAASGTIDYALSGFLY